PDQLDATSAGAHYGRALALAESRGMRPLIAHCRFGLAKLEQRVGELERGHEHLAAAEAMYREMGMDFWLQQVLGMTSSAQARQYPSAGGGSMPTERSLGPPPAVPFSCLPHLLENQAKRIPDAPAVLAPGRAPLTYRRLHQHVESMARTLRT